MPFTYLPGSQYCQIVNGCIDLMIDGEVVCTMTPEDARSNAADFLEMADAIEAGSTIPIGDRELGLK